MKIAIDFVGTNLESGTKTYNINFCDELNLVGKPYCKAHCDVAYIDERELKKEKEAQKSRRIAA